MHHRRTRRRGLVHHRRTRRRGLVHHRSVMVMVRRTPVRGHANVRRHAIVMRHLYDTMGRTDETWTRMQSGTPPVLIETTIPVITVPLVEVSVHEGDRRRNRSHNDWRRRRSHNDRRRRRRRSHNNRRRRRRSHYHWSRRRHDNCRSRRRHDNCWSRSHNHWRLVGHNCSREIDSSSGGI